MFYVLFLQKCLNLAIYLGNKLDNSTGVNRKYYPFAYGRYTYDIGPMAGLFLSLVGVVVLGAPAALIIWLPMFLPLSQGNRTLVSFGLFLMFYAFIIYTLIKELRNKKSNGPKESK